MAPRRSMTYGPGTDTCAEAGAGVSAAMANRTAAAIRVTTFTSATCRPSPSADQPNTYASAPTPASPPPSPGLRLAVGRRRLTPAAEQLWKLATNCCFFLAKLLEPRHGAQPCQPAQLFLIEICHSPSRRNAASF